MINSFYKCVVIGGSGEIGSMFVSLLVQETKEVTVIDICPPSTTNVAYINSSVLSLSEIAKSNITNADLVIVALPESVAVKTVEQITILMRSGSLFIHTLSVQETMYKQISKLNLSIEVAGINPKFSPSLGIEGRPVAIIKQLKGCRLDSFVDLLVSWGAKVVFMKADEHDKLASILQALTHATIFSFGLALINLKVDIEKLNTLATPPFATMMGLLARLGSGNTEVYWDIQKANKNAVLSRESLIDATHSFENSTTSKHIFKENQDLITEALGEDLDYLNRFCSELFMNDIYLKGKRGKDTYDKYQSKVKT